MVCASPPPAGFAAAATHPGAGLGARACRAPAARPRDVLSPGRLSFLFLGGAPGLQFLRLRGA